MTDKVSKWIRNTGIIAGLLVTLVTATWAASTITSDKADNQDLISVMLSVAKLQTSNDHLTKEVKELRSDMRELRDDIKGVLKELRKD